MLRVYRLEWLRCFGAALNFKQNERRVQWRLRNLGWRLFCESGFFSLLCRLWNAACPTMSDFKQRGIYGRGCRSSKKVQTAPTVTTTTTVLTQPWAPKATRSFLVQIRCWNHPARKPKENPRWRIVCVFMQEYLSLKHLTWVCFPCWLLRFLRFRVAICWLSNSHRRRGNGVLQNMLESSKYQRRVN